jgi:hypothetical protein
MQNYAGIRLFLCACQTTSISLIDMTFKTLSKRQNGTVDPSLFSLHLIEGRVIPDWKKFISSGENIIIKPFLHVLTAIKACHL